MKVIGMGDYLIDKQKRKPIAPADTAMCLRALQHEDEDIVSRACLCFADLARRDFFKKTSRADLDRITALLIKNLDSEHVDTASWSARSNSATWPGRADNRRLRASRRRTCPPAGGTAPSASPPGSRAPRGALRSGRRRSAPPSGRASRRPS